MTGVQTSSRATLKLVTISRITGKQEEKLVTGMSEIKSRLLRINLALKYHTIGIQYIYIYICHQFNPTSKVIDGDEDIEYRILVTSSPLRTQIRHPSHLLDHQFFTKQLLMHWKHTKYLLYSLQSDQDTNELQELLQREECQLEGYLRQEKSAKTQRRITRFL